MFKIRPFAKSDIARVKIFTDAEIGTGYFSIPELEDIHLRSTKNGVTFSLVLEKNTESHPHEIHGVRITFPPQNWLSGKGKGLSTETWKKNWNVTMDHVGYFQSLFLSKEVQGQGWGKKISQQSIDLLKTNGAAAIITHAWKQSPHNSSLKYLNKLGFEMIVEHPEYWIDVDYECTFDGNPCKCTAVEMLLKL